MTQPLSESDILFPHLSNTPNLSNTLSSLRRSTLSIHNRLTSILSDSTFVATVSSSYDLPLVANERCGSWYIPPSQKRGSVYFKSTDGHMSQWQFSLRRLNLQLLDVVKQWGGAVVVDSTRRGKSMPDALSKTVPVWCCVVNRVVFGEGKLYTPPTAVGESEHSQIEGKIAGFVKSYLDVCKPDLASLRAKLQKPLRPIWVTQESSLPGAAPSFPDFHPIVLCTASRRVRGAETSENGYVQGAADDHEAWAHGLSPTIFWEHMESLMNCSEDDAPALIEKLSAEEQDSVATTTLITPSTNLYISSSENVDLQPFDVVVSCTPEPMPVAALKSASTKHYVHLKCQTGKLGSRDLRTQLPQYLDYITSLLTPSVGKILVCCPTGKDLSVGTALAILCLCAADNGELSSPKRSAAEINKDFIKQRLSWITLSNPALNPSRATLQSINAVLLSSQAPKSSIKPLPIRSKPAAPHTPDQDLPSTPTTTPPSQTPSTIFSSLHRHPWTFSRTLTSALPSHPSGTVTGTATFTPCSLPPNFPPTLLYAEQGAFVTDTGLRFSARRKYVYQLVGAGHADADEHIAVRFFDDEKAPRLSVEDGVGTQGEGVGGLFVQMGDVAIGDGGAWAAENVETHLCGKDLYAARWGFGAGMVVGKEGAEERWWEVRYDVRGPRKDYVSTTRYERVR